MERPAETVIVAFLQNQWFNDPDGVREILARHDERFRRRFLASTLFMGCLTGRRLCAAFGEALCGRIIWEEASREIGGRAASVFPPDLAHIHAVIAELRPTYVLTFGKVAMDGVARASTVGPLPFFTVVAGPHPAARHATVCYELAEVAGFVRKAVTHA